MSSTATWNALTTARNQGYTDQQIVDFLARSDTRVAAAVKAGHDPEEIVSFLARQSAPKEMRAEAYREEAVQQARGSRPKPAPVKPIETGTFGLSTDNYIGRAVTKTHQSLAGIGSGIARVAAAPIADTDLGRAISDKADRVDQFVNAPIAGATEFKDIRGPGDFGMWVAENLPGSLASMPALAHPVGWAALGTGTTGNIAQARAEADGREHATLGDVAVAAPFGVASTALDKYGFDKVLGGTGGTIATRIGKAMLAEGLTETAQGGIEYSGGALGTKQGFDTGEAGSQMLQSGILGAAGGGLVHGGVEIVGRGRGGKPAPAPSSPGQGIGAGLVDVTVAATSGAPAKAVTVSVTPSDVASPIPTDLIAEGKAEVAAASGAASAEAALKGAGLPGVGKRVQIDMPGATAPLTGTIADVFETDAGELGKQGGVNIALDNGATFTEHFATLADTGVKISELAPLPAAPSITPAEPAARYRPVVKPEREPKEGAGIHSGIYGGLVERGIPEHIARGAAAGVHAESASDHRAVNPTSGAYGIGQWLGPRKAELFKRYGENPTLEQQIDFLAWEMKGGDHGGKAVMSAADDVSALDAYIRKFMRPAAGAETDGDLRRGMAALGAAMQEGTPSSEQGSAAPSAPEAFRTELEFEPDHAARAAIEEQTTQVANPTDAQKEAGNYRKGHVRLHGLDITIETPRGSERSGTAPDGTSWSVAMPDHYGYVKRTKGADGEQVDVYVGPQPESRTVYVIDQNDADTGGFDEHKAMLGYDSLNAATEAYHAAFDDGRGSERMGAVTEMSVDEFRGWLASEQTKPAAEAPEGADLAPSQPKTVSDPAAAEETGTGAEAPAMATTIEDMPSGKSVIVRGLDNSADSEAKVRAALPEKSRPLWNAKERGWVVSKKHEAKLRAVLESNQPATPDARETDAQEPESAPQPATPKPDADLYDRAVTIVREANTGSTSLVQRKLGLGYNAAAKLIERMERDGVVGAANAKGKREVLRPEAGASTSEKSGLHAKIDADFTANRAVLGNFKKGDKVEFDHVNFYRDGRARTFTGTVEKIQDKQQGIVKVIGEGGADYAVPARQLRHAPQEREPGIGSTPAQVEKARDSADAANAQQEAEQASVASDDGKEAAREAGAEAFAKGASRVPPGFLFDAEHKKAWLAGWDQANIAAPDAKRGYGATNKVFTADAAEKARALLRSKMSQLNSGFDPEIAQAGLTLMGYHIEAGARAFMDAARAVAADLGVSPADLRRSLRSWYTAARNWMEDNDLDTGGMDDDAAVKVDLSRIDQWGVTGETSAPAGDIQESENGDANAQPERIEGDDRDRDAGRGAEGVRAGESDREAGRDPEQPRRGGDPDLRTDDGGRGTADRNDHGPAGPDAGKPARKKRGDRNSDQPGNRVSARGKPKRADRGVDYAAPAGSLKRQGGWKATAELNLDIIELVNRLEAELRPATPEEQAQLVKFTGWGAGEIRNNLFRTTKRNADGQRVIVPPAWGEWRDLGQRAAKLLTGDALESALQSTQYAHYTSEAVIRSIWQGVERLGFAGGKILEPGMGTGLFAVAAPENVMRGSHYTGIELDAFTAKVASYLLPQEAVIHGDYTAQKFPDAFFDLAIGNPPFANTQITNDPAYRRHRFSLHDYFFAKTIDKVRPGGLLVFVTSRYTMDKLDPKARDYITARADLLGAIRLPQTAFKENAGTEVVTDVLFLQRRATDTTEAGKSWTTVEPLPDGPAKGTNINSYYIEHPEMVLGSHAATGSMYRANDYTVIPGEGDIDTAFAKAIENLPQNVFIAAAPEAKAKAEAKTLEADMRPAADKEGAVYLKDGSLYVRDEGVGRALADVNKLSAKDVAWLKDYVPLRDAVKQAQRDQLADGDWQASLKALNKVYDAFVKKHGQISAFTTSERTFEKADGEKETRTYRRFTHRRRLDMDVESSLVEALEKISDDGKISKGPFLLDRTLKKPTRPQITTAHDAVAVTLDEIGRLDLDYAADLIGKSRADVIAELGEEIYEQTDGSWQMADEFLSGDVVAKMDEAQVAARSDPRFERNVEALAKVMPKPLAYSDIAVRLGAGWIEPEVVEQFANEVLDEKIEGITYEPAIGAWNVPDATRRIGRSAASEWATEDRSARELLDAVLNNRTIKITRQDSDKKTYTDQEATALANERARKISDKFKTWIWTDAARARRLSGKYNRMFNNLAPRKFDGSHLTFPGLSTRYNLYDHQRRAIWRVIATGNTYLNHAVGAGKTLEMIVAGMEQRRLGLIRKPMYVVPNHMLNQFAREFLDAYPAANIMVADENAFHTGNRRRFMAQAALNDPDAIIISHSSFGKIAPSKEARGAVIDRFVEELEAAIKAVSDNRIGRSKIEKQIENLKRRFEGKAADEGKDKALTFEEMGIDFLFLDEAHEFRKLDFATNRTAVKGIDANGSQRALDLYIKLLWLNEQNPGRAAVLASGTPVTNTMAEIYTVMRYMDQAGLERDGIGAFDAWAAMFGEVVPGFEQNAAGGYEIVERFSKFVNVPELMKRVRTFMDVLTSDQLGTLVKRPDVRGGVPENVVVEASEDLDDYMKVTLRERIETSRKWKPSKDQPGNPDPLINIITDGRLSAIDMRFVDPRAPSDPDSKLNRMIDNIIEKHREYEAIEFKDPKTGEPIARKGATQIVFSAVGFGDMVAKNRGFDARAWVDQRLTEAGIPRDAIAWMGDQNTHAKKEATFKAMRNAEKRLLLGSPKNMGTGVNVQARLKALHFLSPPWYPSDVEQPHGRIIRQGNMNGEVELFWYATKGTYDSTAWNMVSRKQRFIEQAMRGDDSIRAIEDISEANQYEMASALAAGDERAIQLSGLSNDIERLTKLRSAHADEQNSLEYRMQMLDRHITRLAAETADQAAAIEARGALKPFSMIVGKASFDRPGEAGEALLDAAEKAMNNFLPGSPDRVEIGRLWGEMPVLIALTRDKFDGRMRTFADIIVKIGPLDQVIYDNLRGLDGIDAVGLSQRIGNAANRLEGDMAKREQQLEQARREMAQAGHKIGTPFEYEGELAEKVAERARIETELAAETIAAAKARAERDAAAAKESRPQDEAPVITLTGDEIGAAADIADMGRLARAWFKANLRGRTVLSSDGAKVGFSRVGEGKLSGGDRILRAVPAIPAIIEKGVHEGPFPPSAKWAQRGAIAAHRYSAAVQVAGESRRYGVLVQEFGDGRRYYSITDQPEDVGSQSSRTEGRQAVARVEVTPDAALNLFTAEDVGKGVLQLGEATKARIDAAQRMLDERLDALGLAPRVKVNLLAGISTMVQGRYWPPLRLIEVALDAPDGIRFVLDHEAIHALRDLGLFSKTDWNLLVNAAKRFPGLWSSIESRYADAKPALREEEAVADLFAMHRRGDLSGGLAERIIMKAIQFLSALRNALRGAGFQTTRTWREVFADIESGKMASARSLPAEPEAILAGDARESRPTGAVAFDDPDTEARYRAATDGLGDTRSLRERIAEHWEHAWQGISRHWIALPNEPRYAELQQKLRAIEAAPQHARERTIRILDEMVKDFTDADLDLFTRKVILDDLFWDAGQGRELPFGFTPGTLMVEKQKVDALVTQGTNPKVWNAVMRRKLVNRQIAQELVEVGVLEAEQIKNPAYYRHQVLEYARAQMKLAHSPGKKLKTPKWAKRMGSSLDINANLLEAEFDWLNKALVDIPVARTIEWIKKSDHNILDDLSKEARDSNKAGIAEKLAEAHDMLAEPAGHGDEDLEKAALLIDQEKGFRQNIARGFQIVRQALEADAFDVPARLQRAADALSAGKGDTANPPFELLAWMLDNDVDGAMGAAMVMKAIGQRRAWTKELLGRSYIDPDNAEELAKRLAPEGYRTWQPDEGKLLFTVKTLPEHVMDTMLEKLDAPEGVDPVAFRAMLEKSRNMLAMGGSRYTMILPEEVADTLNQLRRPDVSSVYDHLVREPVRWWKRWVLINPRRVIKYNLNNLSGDLDAVIAGNPRLLRRVPEAAKELASVMRGTAKPSSRYEQAVARGVFDSGLSVQEIPDLHKLEPFERFANKAGPLNKITILPLRKAWDALQGATQWRENVFRYAAYLDYADRLEAGESQASIGYGASRRDMVDAVPDKQDRAALLARDLLGDYGAISHYGANLRESVLPFFSWMEINTKRYWRLTSNAFGEGVVKGVATGSGVAAAKGARFTAWAVIRMGMLYGLMTLWNHLLWPDEEDELDEMQQQQLHVILGRNEASEIVTLRLQGSMSDALGWFGLGDVASAMHEYELGRGSLLDIAAAPPKAAINKIGTSLSPAITVPMEAATGKKLWPDVFNTRANRDPWRNLLGTFSLDNEYDALMSKPSRGYARSWQETVIYRRDPGEIAYNASRGLAYDWLRREKGQEFAGGFSSDRANAARDYRTALKFGDEDAAEAALREMSDLGVTGKDFSAMIKRAAPLAPIAKKDRRAFVDQLTDEEFETFQRAQEWYERTFLAR